MIRTPIFALLSMCMQEDFCWEENVTKMIKEGVHKFLKIDDYIEKIKAKRYLKDWKRILMDMCKDNQLTDTQCINFPNMNVSTIEDQDWFTFAAFVPAGYHQVLIYDPKLERAFCQDFVVK